jgi:alpha-tubulin suppressor-like RCC1 family protein
LNKKGQVFLLGKSSIIGRDNKISTNKKDTIELNLENIRKVESGVNYSMALSDDGRVYVWGNNTFGQLGTGSLKNEN